jgi:[ribosomal protein S5]-alanine N-acetyltransferase
MVRTERLHLVPCTPDIVRVMMETPHELASLFQVTIPENWPTPDLKEASSYFLSRLEEDPLAYVWLIWVILSEADRSVVGDIGFKGKPDAEGTVEMGYSIIPAFRRRGFAVEAARGLVRWAAGTGEVKMIVAECDSDNAGSMRVLEKLQMERTEIAGEVVRWRLKLPG